MNHSVTITPDSTDEQLAQAIFPHHWFGTIFEVNTQNIGATWLIDDLQKFPPYLLAHHRSQYADMIGELLESAVSVHQSDYFRRYVDSHLVAQGRDQLILCSRHFAHQQYAQNEVNRDIYAQIARAYGYTLDDKIMFYNTYELITSLENPEFHKMVARKALIIDVNDFVHAPDTPRGVKRIVAMMRKLFEPVLLWAWSKAVSSKVWSSQDNIAPEFIVPSISSRVIDADSILDYNELRPTHVLKHNRSYGGKWIYLPWSRDIQGDTWASLSHLKENNQWFVLQQYVPLPRKLHIDESGNIVTHQVDVRAFTLVHGNCDMELEVFARTNTVDMPCNATSGWSFAPIYVVPDDQYMTWQRRIACALSKLNHNEKHELRSIAQKFMNDEMYFYFRQYTLSVVPHIISLSAYDRIQKAATSVVEGLAKSRHIFKIKNGNLHGVTQMAIDMAVNPLPNEESRYNHQLLH